MQPVLYINTDRIRAVLGLTERELSDKQITDVSVAERLTIRLSKVYPDHADLKAKVDGGTATPEELQTWNILLIFLDYQAASYMLPQFQMLVVKRISDGDVDMTRFGPDDLQQLRDLINGTLDEYLGLLDPEHTAWQPLVAFSRVPPVYNPVTFEGGDTL